MSDPRKEFLEEVEGCVCRDRHNSYDDPGRNFDRIARIASVLLESKLSKPLDEIDVALFSMAIKMGRLAFNPRHYDSWVDSAGYSACAGGILKEQDRDERPATPITDALEERLGEIIFGSEFNETVPDLQPRVDGVHVS